MSAECSSDIIDLALAEDIGSGDITSECFVTPDRQARAMIVARCECVLAGVSVAAEVFRRVDPGLQIQVLRKDGDSLDAGDIALRIEGRAGPILTAERTALNFIQRLSGVATLASTYVSAVAGTGVKILDTRKTTPGMRTLEKQAAAAGGATNHRIGLYDMAMVKDNHLSAAGSVDSLREGIARLKSLHPGVKLEVEVDTIDQLREVLALDGVDVVLLDNMSLTMLREAVAIRKPGVLLEASGGVTLETIGAIAATGVDFISVGAITHSAAAADFALDFQEE